jgi:nicotinamidase-related amidase
MATLKSAWTTPTALLCVDIQIGLNVTDTAYYGRARSNPSFERNIAGLLAAARRCEAHGHNVPLEIIHVTHRSSDPNSPLYPGKASAGIQPCAAPAEGETQLTKTANSAFVGTELADLIRAAGIKQFFIAGIATDHCVSTTARMAADLEVCGTREGVWLVEDCTACFDNHGSFDAETVQKVNVESLKDEFCGVTNSDEIIRKVLTDS